MGGTHICNTCWEDSQHNFPPDHVGRCWWMRMVSIHQRGWLVLRSWEVGGRISYVGVIDIKFTGNCEGKWWRFSLWVSSQSVPVLWMTVCQKNALVKKQMLGIECRCGGLILPLLRGCTSWCRKRWESFKVDVLTSNVLPGNPDGTLCKAAKMEDMLIPQHGVWCRKNEWVKPYECCHRKDHHLSLRVRRCFKNVKWLDQIQKGILPV